MGYEFSGVIEEIWGEMEFFLGDCVVIEFMFSCRMCEVCVRG